MVDCTGDWYQGDGNWCSTIAGLLLDSTEGLTGAAETKFGVLSHLGGGGGAAEAMRLLAASTASGVEGSWRSWSSQREECWEPGLDCSCAGAGVDVTFVSGAELPWPNTDLMVVGSCTSLGLREQPLLGVLFLWGTGD